MRTTLILLGALKNTLILLREYTSMLLFDSLGWCVGDNWKAQRFASNRIYMHLKDVYLNKQGKSPKDVYEANERLLNEYKSQLPINKN